MNYTKFLRNVKAYSNTSNYPTSNKKDKYKIISTDEKIKISKEIFKDIQKTKILLQNYIRIDFKLDIDEYMAYFLKDKNEFINEFKEYLEKEGRILNLLTRKNYIEILEILKLEIDIVLRDFKNLKAKMLKKMNKKENFYKMKENFVKTYKASENEKQKNFSVSTVSSMFQISFNKIGLLGNKSKSDQLSKKTDVKNINSYTEDKLINYDSTVKDEDNIYRDSASVMNIFKESDSKDLEKTKTLIFELSDLMTSFSSKVLEHQDITQNIVTNASQSLDNAQNANKELVKCQEYQKGRGLIIGTLFIILGLFLLYYDYAL